MAFPSNPTNGQKANVNGVTYTYNSTLSAWTVTSSFLDSFSGNLLTANNVTTANTVSATLVTTGTATATGNITASYFLGNGSQLTGVDSTAITNGTSRVSVALNGNVTTNVAGTTITTVSNFGLDTPFLTTPRTISANTTVDNVNAMTVGPIIIANNITVTVNSGGEWSII